MATRPDRYRNAIVPHIYVDGASAGIDFYKRAFGAVELLRIAHPSGKILHAAVSIYGSVIMIGDPDDKLRPRSVWPRMGAPVGKDSRASVQLPGIDRRLAEPVGTSRHSACIRFMNNQVALRSTTA
jgi:hypothetical protein